jgi:ABC-type nitrate/sulfonate/bicarbonate transport system substrate-binding protein
LSDANPSGSIGQNLIRPNWHYYCGIDLVTKRAVLKNRYEHKLLILGLILSTLGIFFLAGKAHTSPRERELIIAAPKTLSMGLIALAESDKLFAKHGQTVKVRWTITGADANQLLFEGKADLAAAYDSVIINNHLKKRPQRIYSKLHSAKRSTVLAVGVDRGIKGVKDLKGKKIGVTRRTNAHYFIKSLLENHILGLKEVHLVFGDPYELTELYRKKGIDGVVTWEPYLSELLATRQSTLLYSDFYVENSLLIGKKSDSEDKKAEVANVLGALFDASRLIRQDNTGSKRKILAAINAQESPSINRSWKLQWLDLGVTNLLVGQLNFQRDWILTEMRYPKDPDRRITDEFYMAPLKKLSPYLATIVGGD